MKKIGILYLQGGFDKHALILKKLGVQVKEVRLENDLANIDSLIIPGGESTTNIKLISRYNLLKPIQNFAKEHPVFGTCSGAILMSKCVTNFPFPTLSLIDVHIQRNAYGTQKNSFYATLNFNKEKIKVLFIRAPKLEKIGHNIHILSKYNNEPVIVRNHNHLIATCHPELSEEYAVHEYFLKNF